MHVLLVRRSPQEDKYSEELRNHDITVSILQGIQTQVCNTEHFYEYIKNHQNFDGIVITSGTAATELNRLFNEEADLREAWEAKNFYILGDNVMKILGNYSLMFKGQISGSAQKLSAFMVDDCHGRPRRLLYPHSDLVNPKRFESKWVSVTGCMLYK